MEKIKRTYGNFTFELKAFREIAGHDDSLPFTASLYINNKRVATVTNDGWGGDAVVYPNGKNSALLDIAMKAVAQYEPDAYWHNIGALCDLMASEIVDAKMTDKFIKKHPFDLIFRNERHIVAVPITNKAGLHVDASKVATINSGLIKSIIEKYVKQGYTHIKTF